MRLWIVVLLRRGRERGKDVRCDGDRAEVLAQGGNGTCGPARRGTAVGRRPGNGNEALLEGKSRRAGRVRKGGRRAAFSQGSAGISCRRKAETTWPASCSRASLFDIVELSTYCEARCTTTGLSLFRELVSGGSAVFTMSRQKKTAPPANRTTRSRGRWAKSRKHETPDTYDPGLGTGALQARRFGARPLGKNNGGVIVPSSIFGKKEDTPKSLLR